MNQDLERTSSFSSSGSSRSMNASSSVRSMGTGAPLPPPSLLIPGKHLPEPTSLIEMEQGSPMDVSVLTTPVEAPKLTLSLSAPALGGAEGEMMSNSHNKEEKVGRWSEQEHKVFLEGLERYGKQWKTIALMIGTRTVVQVRTHAQKYFQKVERKNKDSGKHNTATGSVAGSVSTCSSSASATAATTTAALVSTHIPSPRMTVKTATTAAIKRKSLTGGGAVTATSASAPSSRKKSKSPKKTAPRMVSISLSTTSPPPSLLELPHFISNASSLENLSTISPVGVADMDLGLVSSYSTMNPCGGEVSFAMPKNSNFTYNSDNMYAMDASSGGMMMMDQQEAESGIGLDVADELGEDPLEWLIDGGINHLPESSLEAAPMFPDFSDVAEHGGGVTVQVQPKSFDPTSFLQDIADPKVTVQSLFLEAPTPAGAASDNAAAAAQAFA